MTNATHAATADHYRNEYRRAFAGAITKNAKLFAAVVSDIVECLNDGEPGAHPSDFVFVANYVADFDAATWTNIAAANGAHFYIAAAAMAKAGYRI